MKRLERHAKMSSLDVEAVLSSSSSLPSCEVSRVLETDLVDEGNLVLVESNRAENLDEQKLQSLARENAQVRKNIVAFEPRTFVLMLYSLLLFLRSC